MQKENDGIFLWGRECEHYLWMVDFFQGESFHGWVGVKNIFEYGLRNVLEAGQNHLAGWHLFLFLGGQISFSLEAWGKNVTKGR